MRTRVADAFLDTNILIYLLSADASKADRAGELLERGGIVSVQVLNEFTAVAIRKLHMKVVEIREILATVRQLCKVIPLDLTTHDRALELVERHRLSIFDALIVSAAIGADCTTLWSEDLRHGHKIDRLTIRNPFVS
jgi:predicted nucleic acid-binding protein